MEIFSRGLFLLALALVGANECERHELGDCLQDNSFIQMQLSLDMDSANQNVMEEPRDSAAATAKGVKEKAKEFKEKVQKVKDFKAAVATRKSVKEKVEAFKAAEAAKEHVKEKVKEFKEKAEAFKAAATAKKLVKAAEEADEAKNVIVVDDRNFTQLKDDLSYAGENLALAKDLSSTFEQAVLRSTLAQHQVVEAEAERQEILKKIHKLLNKTIALEAMTKDDLILELKSFNASGVQSQTASAAELAAEAAKLAQDLSGCEARIVEALERREAAMTQQAEAVKQIQTNLRSSILVEMNDTRLVQILDASDRSQMVPVPSVPSVPSTTTTNTVLQDILDRLEVTVNVKTEGEAAKEEAAEGEVLYPTDWAVIGVLILVIVFVTALVCYARTSGTSGTSGTSER
mmetsp:Transcript_40959/g.64567  ORF Transcript_40959/g.64567 Transcript_40959/m.64567 type:complete len:403 (+) Transcript_40959:80-1288(+)